MYNVSGSVCLEVSSCIGTRIAICRIIDPSTFRTWRYMYAR